MPSVKPTLTIPDDIDAVVRNALQEDVGHGIAIAVELHIAGRCGQRHGRQCFAQRRLVVLRWRR